MLGMNVITFNPPPLRGYRRCEQIFTVFFSFNMKPVPRYSALTEQDWDPSRGRQRVDKVSEETRTQFAALLTISRDDH